MNANSYLTLTSLNYHHSLQNVTWKAVKEGDDLLEGWRDTVKEMYPDDDALLALILRQSDLFLAKFNNASIMTDN